MSGLQGAFRVTYARYGELRDDLAQQMVRGGLLVKVHDAPGLDFDSAVDLELVLPDGTTLQGTGKVLQVFAGVGFAVTVQPQLVEEVSRLADRPEVAVTGETRHERIERAAPHPVPPARSRRPSAPSSLWLSAVPLRRPATRPPPVAAAALGTSPPFTATDALDLFAGLPSPAAPAAPPAPAPSTSTRSDNLSRIEKVQKA
ncbi:MAG TPA: hypothetical protein VHW23_46655, partial [Kofleriaceae bacterium]|nr:hypothetical protein [Kofleriaceae bacterium]